MTRFGKSLSFERQLEGCPNFSKTPPCEGLLCVYCENIGLRKQPGASAFAAARGIERLCSRQFKGLLVIHQTGRYGIHTVPHLHKTLPSAFHRSACSNLFRRSKIGNLETQAQKHAWQNSSSPLPHEAIPVRSALRNRCSGISCFSECIYRRGGFLLASHKGDTTYMG